MASVQPELHSIHPHRAPPFAFAARSEPTRVHEPDASTHVLLKHTSLEPGEFERPELEVLEVMGSWGSTILFARHLSPARDFFLGEGSSAEPVDFEMPVTGLAATRFPLIEMRAGTPHLVVVAGASARIKHPGTNGFAPSPAASVALLSGTVVELTVGRVTFRVANVAAGKPTPRLGFKDRDRSLFAAFGLSFTAVAALIAGFAFWMPALGLTDGDELDSDRLETMKQYLNAQAERNREDTADKNESGEKNNEPGAPSEAAAGREGALGKPDMKPTNRRAAVSGDSPTTELSHAQAVEAAKNFGMIELLGSLSTQAGSSSPFERNPALGHDGIDAEGALWGDQIGESGGNGLRLSGLDNGGGGHGVGVGIVGIGTCGAGNCGPSGFGHDLGRVSGQHKPTGPVIHPIGNTTVSGTLPAEIVQRIVRQNYGRFRMCYETGLRGNPNLTGRVSARFVIGRDGAVLNVQNGGSDLPDSGVVSCVVQAFYGLSFPSPENGTVKVTYPIMFSPG